MHAAWKRAAKETIGWSYKHISVFAEHNANYCIAEKNFIWILIWIQTKPATFENL
jgi:hypothetical protein